MAFNHYAKIKRILDQSPPGWYIVRINESTTAQAFNGEKRYYDHYYRIHDSTGAPIKYCKFQQLARLSQVLGVPVEDLPVVEESL